MAVFGRLFSLLSTPPLPFYKLLLLFRRVKDYSLLIAIGVEDERVSAVNLCRCHKIMASKYKI